MDVGIGMRAWLGIAFVNHSTRAPARGPNTSRYEDRAQPKNQAIQVSSGIIRLPRISSMQFSSIQLHKHAAFREENSTPLQHDVDTDKPPAHCALHTGIGATVFQRGWRPTVEPQRAESAADGPLSTVEPQRTAIKTVNGINENL